MSHQVKCEQTANILRETKHTSAWVVIVPTTDRFVTFANRVKGAVLAGQEDSFCDCAFVIAILCI